MDEFCVPLRCSRCDSVFNSEFLTKDNECPVCRRTGCSEEIKGVTLPLAGIKASQLLSMVSVHSRVGEIYYTVSPPDNLPYRRFSEKGFEHLCELHDIYITDFWISVEHDSDKQECGTYVKVVTNMYDYNSAIAKLNIELVDIEAQMTTLQEQLDELQEQRAKMT